MFDKSRSREGQRSRSLAGPVCAGKGLGPGERVSGVFVRDLGW